MDTRCTDEGLVVRDGLSSQAALVFEDKMGSLVWRTGTHPLCVFACFVFVFTTSLAAVETRDMRGMMRIMIGADDLHDAECCP